MKMIKNDCRENKKIAEKKGRTQRSLIGQKKLKIMG